MTAAAQSPVYLQIALDIAARIARGELKPGAKIHGRSVMAGEYGVSPETVRRALRLLEDMEVVEVKEKSGAIVLSADNAQSYIERFNAKSGTRALQGELKQTILEQAALQKKMLETVSRIMDSTDRFSRTNPFQNLELDVPDGSPVLGETPASLQFWQKTGATIIAIRREEKIYLSPGSYIRFEAGDSIIFVGDVRAADAVQALLEPPEIP